MKEIKPLKTWEKIVAVAITVIGLMLFHDTGRIEALLLAIVMSAILWAKLRAWWEVS